MVIFHSYVKLPEGTCIVFNDLPIIDDRFFDGHVTGWGKAVLLVKSI